MNTVRKSTSMGVVKCTSLEPNDREWVDLIPGKIKIRAKGNGLYTVEGMIGERTFFEFKSTFQGPAQALKFRDELIRRMKDALPQS